MRFICIAISAYLFCSLATSTPLDDYVNREESVYGWKYLNETFKTVFGGQAHVLNVTTQTWLDKSRAGVFIGNDQYTNVWSHHVVVIVPKTLKTTNVSLAYLTGGCNQDGIPKSTDEDVLVADEIAHSTSAVAIVVFQIPNCPVVFPRDPSKRHRDEDALIAWAWKEYLDGAQGKTPGGADAKWLPRLPMVKGGMQSMRAVEDFLRGTLNVIPKDEEHGWIVAGASKRGWTTWMVGSVHCDACVRIVGIAPLVPIVPSLHREMHRQFQSYDGWTFAFKDYTDVNMTEHTDDPEFADALKIIDPLYYGERLQRLPKLVVLSSNDEFMSFDWSNVWYDEMKGETHLLIAQNSEHSLATGLPEVLSCMSTFARSIAIGQGETQRPSFDYTFNGTEGSIRVVPRGSLKPSKVVMRHSQTISSERRDFRWIRASNNDTEKCTLPNIHLKKPVFGADCFVPIVWIGTTLEAESDGSYVAKAPKPFDGHWSGFYVELYFPAEFSSSDYQFTSPGFTFPNTLPFADCSGASCKGKLV